MFGREAALDEEPLEMAHGVERHGERLAVRVRELRLDVHGRRARVARVRDVVAVHPHAHRVDRPLHGHGRGRTERDARVRTRPAVDEARHGVAEEAVRVGAREGGDGVRGRDGPSRRVHEGQQHRPVVGRAVRPVEFIRTHGGRARKGGGRERRDQRKPFHASGRDVAHVDLAGSLVHGVEADLLAVGTVARVEVAAPVRLAVRFRHEERAHRPSGR